MKTVNLEGARLSADALATVRDWQDGGLLHDRLRGLSKVQDFLTNMVLDTWAAASTIGGDMDYRGMLVEVMQLKEEHLSFGSDSEGGLD